MPCFHHGKASHSLILATVLALLQEQVEKPPPSWAADTEPQVERPPLHSQVRLSLELRRSSPRKERNQTAKTHPSSSWPWWPPGLPQHGSCCGPAQAPGYLLPDSPSFLLTSGISQCNHKESEGMIYSCNLIDVRIRTPATVHTQR